MEEISIEHLDHVKNMIFVGIKNEMRDEILSQYSISDQLNATGEEADTMKAAIAAILDAGHAKQDAVMACTTFEELNAIVPRVENEPTEPEA